MPLAALAYATRSVIAESLATSERLIQIAAAEQVDARVDRVLEESARAVRSTGRALYDSRLGDAAARIVLARDVVRGADALVDVAIYTDDGTLVDAIRRADAEGAAPPPPLPVDREAYTDGGWLPPELVDGQMRLRYLLHLEHGGQRAWLAGTLRAAVLDEIAGAASQQVFGRRDRVLLLDDEVRVLARGAPAQPAVGTTLAGRDLAAAANLEKSAFRAGFGVTTEWTDATGERMVGTVRVMPQRGWATAVRRPRAEAFATLRRAELVIAGATALFIALALVGGIILSSRIVTPVGQLVGLTSAYAAGRLDERSPVRTGDELEELGEAMTSMAGAIAASQAELAQRAVVEANLSRFLPAEVAAKIAAGQIGIALGGRRSDVSVLFADIVAFTSFAEASPPEQTVAILNEVFTVMSEVVFRHGGIVDKLIGDSLMAVFGAPEAASDHAARALRTAEDLHRFVEAAAPSWKDKYGVSIKIAIGVNSGSAVVGNIGSERRMEYTAIGDIVNVAARLESSARPGQTLLTRQVADAVGDEFSFVSLGEQAIRGKKQGIEVLALQSGGAA